MKKLDIEKELQEIEDMQIIINLRIEGIKNYYKKLKEK